MKVRGTNGLIVDVTDAVATAMTSAGHVELILDPSEEPALTQLLSSQGEGTPGGQDTDNVDLFDPSTHSVDEVLAHLRGIDDTDPQAHDAEVVRILAAEKAGKARKGIVDTVEGTPDTGE